MTQSSLPWHPRLVLVARPSLMGSDPAGLLASALTGGDVASLIIVEEAGHRDFQAFAEALVPVAQAANAAVMIAGDSRIAGRARADGIHLVDADRSALDDAMAKAAGRTMVGVSGGATRHEALELGEAGPDYVFFGKLDGDTWEDPHPLNIERAEWWSAMIEIPCIAMGGSAVANIKPLIAAGPDFVALGAAVFSASDPAQAVRDANAMLAQGGA